jgi:hypothetical protein
VTRRQFIHAAAAGLAGGSAPSTGCRRPQSRHRHLRPSAALDLDDLAYSTARYFWEAAHPRTGQVLDRRRADGKEETRRVASIAATGFGLSALSVAAHRSWRPHSILRDQVLRTLRHLRDEMPNVHGFYYHFHDWETGARMWNCEVSSIDTSLLMAGVLTCRACFSDPEIIRLATELYERVDWPWMLNGSQAFSMGWRPETGFLESRWDHYCELMVLYWLALGSPTHPVPTSTWLSWSRPLRTYYGETFVWSPAPLFVHQFSHAWLDFRAWRDRGVDWFENSRAATNAHRLWSLDHRNRFPLWSDDLWGVTSSDSAHGYVAWGGPPDTGPLDGTIVPCAAAGSLPFLPEACLRTLAFQKAHYGGLIWCRYGFVDAFNPHNGWVNPDVIGIDLGITLLMVENLASGLIWGLFNQDPAIRTAFSSVQSG